MIISDSKIRFIAEIVRDIGQVLFASVFIGPLMSGGANYFIIISGLVLAVFAWSLSLIAIK